MNITLQDIEALDLSYIVETMCSPSYVLPRWQHDAAILCEKKYKRYLWLIKCYPQERLVPTKDIDEFWHNHILHTQRYHDDCLRIFGYYLHHLPDDPDNITEDLLHRFQETKRLFEVTFNHSILENVI